MLSNCLCLCFSHYKYFPNALDIKYKMGIIVRGLISYILYIICMCAKTNNNILYQLGKQIRLKRKKAGLSQEKLSFESGLDRSFIGSIERGERSISLLTLTKISKALSCELSDILNGINIK